MITRSTAKRSFAQSSKQVSKRARAVEISASRVKACTRVKPSDVEGLVGVASPLTDDTLICIFCKLDARGLAACILVCRQWHRAALSPCLWSTIRSNALSSLRQMIWILDRIRHVHGQSSAQVVEFMPETGPISCKAMDRFVAAIRNVREVQVQTQVSCAVTTKLVTRVLSSCPQLSSLSFRPRQRRDLYRVLDLMSSATQLTRVCFGSLREQCSAFKFEHLARLGTCRLPALESLELVLNCKGESAEQLDAMRHVAACAPALRKLFFLVLLASGLPHVHISLVGLLALDHLEILLLGGTVRLDDGQSVIPHLAETRLKGLSLLLLDSPYKLHLANCQFLECLFLGAGLWTDVAVRNCPKLRDVQLLLLAASDLTISNCPALSELRIEPQNSSALVDMSDCPALNALALPISLLPAVCKSISPFNLRSLSLVNPSKENTAYLWINTWRVISLLPLTALELSDLYLPHEPAIRIDSKFIQHLSFLRCRFEGTPELCISCPALQTFKYTLKTQTDTCRVMFGTGTKPGVVSVPETVNIEFSSTCFMSPPSP